MWGIQLRIGQEPRPDGSIRAYVEHLLPDPAPALCIAYIEKQYLTFGLYDLFLQVVPFPEVL